MKIAEELKQLIDELAEQYVPQGRDHFIEKLTAIFKDEIALVGEEAYDKGYDAGYDDGHHGVNFLERQLGDIQQMFKDRSPFWAIGWPRTQSAGSDEVEAVREEAREALDYIWKVVSS